MNYHTPLSIYVVWHPDFKAGKRYADLIYKTFNRDTEFALNRNLNIPVFYRSESDEITKVPIPIPFDEADRNAVVVLIDDELFQSAGWDAYIKDEILTKISSDPESRIYPIAFSRNAYRLEEDSLSRLQFIKADGLKNEDKEREFKKRWRHIRSRLLHDFSRLMYDIESVGDTAEQLQKGDNARPNPPVKLFLSHAKVDGLDLAQQLKRHIQDEHQLDTFFDANEIASSYRFDMQILDQFNENTAVIAVLGNVQ